MKRKLLAGVMAVLMMLSLGTGCDDTLDSSTLAEYDRDSKVMADIKENQKQAESATENLISRLKEDQNSSGSQAELSKEELTELAKIVETNAYAYYCDLVSDNQEFNRLPVLFEVGKTSATDQYIKKLQEYVAKETSDKHKGYWANIIATQSNGKLNISVSISKGFDSEILMEYNKTEDF